MKKINAIAWLACLLAHPCDAAPGDLDTGFAPGVVVTPLGPNAWVAGISVLPDGSVNIGGYWGSSYWGHVSVLRYLADGELDSTYLLNQRATGERVSGVNITGMVTRPDGKVVLATFSAGAPVLVGRNADGTLDRSFGFRGLMDLNGLMSPPFGPPHLFCQDNVGQLLISGFFEAWPTVARVSPGGMWYGASEDLSIWPEAITVQSDRKALVAGRGTGTDGSSDVTIVRLAESGLKDASFGSAGVTTISLPADQVCMGLLVQADGKIVVAGRSADQSWVMRFSSAGVSDASFGVLGQAGSTFNVPSIAYQAMQDSSGRLLVLGQHESEPGIVRHHVLRYLANGSIDPSFGVDGVALLGLTTPSMQTTPSPRSFGGVLGSGKILLGVHASNGSFTEFTLVRLHPDGTRDETYGGGMIRLPGRHTAGSNRYGGAQTMGLLPDGRIRAASYAQTGTTRVSEVFAFKPDGSPDQTFALQGVLALDGVPLLASTLCVRPDGRIVIAGDQQAPLLWAHGQRLPTGAADPDFNGGGLLITSVGGTSTPTVNRMIVDDTGGTITAGAARSSGNLSDIVVARHLSNGTLDSSFGQGGICTTALAERDSVLCMTRTVDGRILIGGGIGPASNSSTSTPLVARYLPNGTLDSSFGSGGTYFPTLEQNTQVTDVVPLPDGRFLAALSPVTRSLAARPLLARFLSNGALDPSFGNNGRAMSSTPAVYARIRGVAVQKDGRIVVVGQAGSTDLLDDEVLVGRYEADGSVDSTFGSQGFRIIPIGDGDDSANEVIIQPDNKILVGASAGVRSESGSANRISYRAIIRLEGGPLLANVALEAPADRSASGVRLRGTVNPNGFATSALFEYGPTASYGQTIPLTLTDANGAVAESVEMLLSGLTAGTTYHYRLTATTAAGTRSTAGSTFSTFSSLETWRQTHFGTAANTGHAADAADFDLDGVPNLLEWACGLSPSQPSRLDTPVNRNASVIEFTYPRDVTAIGAVYQVEWSDTLPGTLWTTVGVSEAIVNQAGTLQTVKATLPVGTNGSRFVRLSVQGPP
jgi:uncharacterized delta-60 repeat protein